MRYAPLGFMISEHSFFGRILNSSVLIQFAEKSQLGLGCKVHGLSPIMLKKATVAHLQGARCDGMAHAISSFGQRHIKSLPFPNRLKKRQLWPICKAPDAMEWLTPFRASGNAA